VIIPTFNEVENITRIIPQVLEQDDRVDILVVDDNSPDGTGDSVEKLARSLRTRRIELIRREGKMGLGTAYVAGFRYAIGKKYDLIFEMDADFSHNPCEIPKFIEEMKTHDLVIGSRYIQGVNVVNWPMSRLILSWSANLYTRIITGLPIHDSTSGYKCFKRKVLESIDLDSIKSDGYGFQIEMDFLAWKKGFRLSEIPIVFVDRNAGESKMNSFIVREAAWMVWKLRISSIFKRL